MFGCYNKKFTILDLRFTVESRRGTPRFYKAKNLKFKIVNLKL